MSNSVPQRRDALTSGGDPVGRIAFPSAVLCFASPFRGGKTTISSEVAVRLGAPWVSFGDYLRREARERGLEVTREALQALGGLLLALDARKFCEDVLGQQPPEPGRPLIVDGVRHLEVLDHIRGLFDPAPVSLVYIDIDRATQRARLDKDEFARGKSVEDIESHPTERQVRSALPGKADLILDGTRAPGELVDEVIDFLAKRT